MSRIPPKDKYPDKLTAAVNTDFDGGGTVGTDADKLSDPAEAETAQSGNRGRRRGGQPGRQPRSETSYAVGYGRPPKHTRFKPGKSGNPKGRSPQSRNLRTTVKQILDEQMPIREGGRVRRMATIEALVRMTMSRALKGDPKALASLIILMKHSGYGTEHVESAPDLLQGVDHEAILEEYLTRLALEASGPLKRGKG